MGILNKVKTNAKTKGESNYVGRQALESDIYPVTVNLMYFGESKNGAVTATINYTTENGQENSETFYMTTNKEKGCQNYFMRNDEPVVMPGYAVVDAILQLGADISLDEVETEDKNVKVYDFKERKEVVKECETVPEIEEAELLFGIRKTKITKGDGSDTFINKVDKVFCADEDYKYATVPELESEEEEFTFYETWLKSNQGREFDESDTAKGNKGKGKSGSRTRKSDDSGSDDDGGSRRKKSRFKRN